MYLPSLQVLGDSSKLISSITCSLLAGQIDHIFSNHHYKSAAL
jgi:hypothetical protein